MGHGWEMKTILRCGSVAPSPLLTCCTSARTAAQPRRWHWRCSIISSIGKSRPSPTFRARGSMGRSSLILSWFTEFAVSIILKFLSLFCIGKTNCWLLAVMLRFVRMRHVLLLLLPNRCFFSFYLWRSPNGLLYFSLLWARNSSILKSEFRFICNYQLQAHQV